MATLRAALESVLALARGPGERWVVALSGGPDSTSLLAALAPLARTRGVALVAVHVDHGLDPGSAGRAVRAQEIAAALDVPFVLCAPRVERRRRESPEAAARRCRYRELEEARVALGATKILTAHHLDDQVETLLLRIGAGTGIAGLAGIPAERGPLLRPLLELRRATLLASLAGFFPPPVEDPTNLERRTPRNRLRHGLLPHLLRADPDLFAALAALPAAARRARGAIDRVLGRRVAIRRLGAGAEVDRREVEAIPAPLRPLALARLLEAAGSVPPPGAARLAPALAALAAGRSFSLDLDGVRLRGEATRLRAAARESPPAAVAYTVSLPGEVELSELGLRMRIRRRPFAPWMVEGRPDRAAFELPAGATSAEVRTRRPGDRLRPIGAPGERKLKELLIDRKVPRAARDRLPLLLVGGRIVWVPGVTVAEENRLRGASEAWVADIAPVGGRGDTEGEVGNDPGAAGVGATGGETT